LFPLHATQTMADPAVEVAQHRRGLAEAEIPPPGVSRFLKLTFGTQPLDLRCRPLVDADFVISCQLVQPSRLLIQFLSVGSYLCSTLPSDPTSR
jgi:hypothetical protein